MVAAATVLTPLRAATTPRPSGGTYTAPSATSRFDWRLDWTGEAFVQSLPELRRQLQFSGLDPSEQGDPRARPEEQFRAIGVLAVADRDHSLVLTWYFRHWLTPLR
ncbi:hypothetical protein GCM10023196_003980 [Actinoallomurus vinaceus]|uniref:Uncharacterized protein n=1 Tax=Actinoallomurus vinaceus TaxID=1080074 RepID=A0ABP8TZK6_9ACTN